MQQKRLIAILIYFDDKDLSIEVAQAHTLVMELFEGFSFSYSGHQTKTAWSKYLRSVFLQRILQLTFWNAAAFLT